MPIRTILCLTALISLCGCVNIRPVTASADALAVYEGKPLTTVTYQKPNFEAMTVGHTILGGPVLGWAADTVAGNRIVAENDIEDPAVAIAAALRVFYSAKLKTNGGETLAGRNSNDVRTLTGAAKGQGLVIDVETLDWNFTGITYDWAHYQVTYTGRARMIDAGNGKEVALATCFWSSGDENPPDYNTLMADQAALLKKILAGAAQSCAATYEQQMLKQ